MQKETKFEAYTILNFAATKSKCLCPLIKVSVSFDRRLHDNLMNVTNQFNIKASAACTLGFFKTVFLLCSKKNPSIRHNCSAVDTILMLWRPIRTQQATSNDSLRKKGPMFDVWTDFKASVPQCSGRITLHLCGNM